MLQIIVHLLVALAGADADSERLRATAPAYLTVDQAVEHLWTARAAAALEGVPAELVLSIAHHESRYQGGTVTPERGGLTSCGVMTPEPIARCRRDGLFDQYRAGARHLRHWIDGADSPCRFARGEAAMRCALTGYAGGVAMVRACARGPLLVERRGARFDACGTWWVFESRAAAIAGRPWTGI